MRKIAYTQNRELSWLRFNERVMDEAKEKDVPVFEKLNFISIFNSNLDEFFMIRVGGLYDQTFLSKPSIDNKTGMDAKKQLDAIFKALPPLYKKRDKIYRQVTDNLSKKGMMCVDVKDLSEKDKKYTKKYFEEFVLPILSPQIINTHHPFPHLANKGLYVALLLKINERAAFGVIPVPTNIERIISLPGERVRYVLLENLVLEYADLVFDNCEIQLKNIISVTRNADMNVDDYVDDDDDLRYRMRKILKKRSRLAPVRLEYSGNMDESMEDFLCEKLELKKNQVFRSKAPLEMSYVYGLLDMVSEDIRESITYDSFKPQLPLWFVPGENMMNKVMAEDLFLSYPYQSIEPFLQLIKEAAVDSRVISIKITIYRLASKAKLVDYLRMAAENGKEVTVIMELRARFDEANNINWSESLEEAGCTVIYGYKDYKVHSKVCQITLMENRKIKRITQIGTGNYNEKTARLYTDMSIMTSDDEIGKDVATFFRNMAIANLNGEYSRLFVAPNSMKSRIIAAIQFEIDKAKRGIEGRIIIKINSLTDREIIDLLKDASQAGVKIDMIIRGICCMLPGIEGYTENIRITSVVGRFLEHSRVYCFGSGEDMRMYISSADFMTRNLNRRVEMACPVKSPEIKKEILGILELMLEDDTKARKLRYDGTYEKKPSKGERPVNCQQELIELALSDKSTHREHRISSTSAGERKYGVLRKGRRFLGGLK